MTLSQYFVSHVVFLLVKHQIHCPSSNWLVPRGSRGPGPGRASLQRRSPQACTSAPPPQTECGRRARWAVVPGSASETRVLKVAPYHARGDSPGQGGSREEQGQNQESFGGGLIRGELRRWRCGRAGRPKSGPQG